MGLGSGIKPIPDPGSGSRGQKAPDPGSATLLVTIYCSQIARTDLEIQENQRSYGDIEIEVSGTDYLDKVNITERTGSTKFVLSFFSTITKGSSVFRSMAVGRVSVTVRYGTVINKIL
jgi:hypothetical protein